MDDLGALAVKKKVGSASLSFSEKPRAGTNEPVAREDDLRARTLADSSIHQRGQRHSSGRISTLEISNNCCTIVHALDSQVLAINYVGEGVEERRPS